MIYLDTVLDNEVYFQTNVVLLFVNVKPRLIAEHRLAIRKSTVVQCYDVLFSVNKQRRKGRIEGSPLW